MTAKDKKEILQIFSEAFEKTAMPVLRRMQNDIKDLRADVKDLTKRVDILEQKVDKLDKRVGSLEQKVDANTAAIKDLTKRVTVLEQKMDAYTGEVIMMHKEIGAALNGWQAHGDKLEKHEARISALEMGYARPSL